MFVAARAKRQLEQQGYRTCRIGPLRGERDLSPSGDRFCLYAIEDKWHLWVGLIVAVKPIGYEAFGMTKRGAVRVNPLPVTFETVQEAALALAERFSPVMTGLYDSTMPLPT
jgi:hypothetical protein